MMIRKMKYSLAVVVAIVAVGVASTVCVQQKKEPMNKDEAYRRLLAEQLVMNERTWATLQERGVTEHTKLRLDFSYAPSSKTNAAALAALLREKTDYEVQTKNTGLFNRKQSVSGTTRPTAISKAILDQWVDWMVTAGLQCGCDFDGWGTEIPEEEGQPSPAN